MEADIYVTNHELCVCVADILIKSWPTMIHSYRNELISLFILSVSSQVPYQYVFVDSAS